MNSFYYKVFQQLCVCLVLCATTTVIAQNQSSPLSPEDVRPERVGVTIGVTGVQQSGEFNVNCDCPGFKSGGGSGIIIGGVYELESYSSIVAGVVGGYHFRSFDAINNLQNDTSLSTADLSTSFQNIPLTSKHKSEVSLAEIFAMPYIKFFPFKKTAFLRLGANIGYIVNSTFNHTIQITQSTVQLQNGETVRLSFDAAKLQARGMKLLTENTALVEEGAIPKLNLLQFALNPAIGAEIRVNKQFWLVPVIQYSLPLTNISSFGKDYKVSSFQFLLELHYTLKAGD